MTIRTVKKVVVTYDDDTVETFERKGRLSVVSTTQVEEKWEGEKLRETIKKIEYVTIGLEGA